MSVDPNLPATPSTVSDVMYGPNPVTSGVMHERPRPSTGGTDVSTPEPAPAPRREGTDAYGTPVPPGKES